MQCDNIQTIRLIAEEITKLQTKLQHVDVHNHWLRQEVNRGRINVTYTKSHEMIEIKAAEEEYRGTRTKNRPVKCIEAAHFHRNQRFSCNRLCEKSLRKMLIRS
jgi:hypothetical protein